MRAAVSWASLRVRCLSSERPSSLRNPKQMVFEQKVGIGNIERPTPANSIVPVIPLPDFNCIGVAAVPCNKTRRLWAMGGDGHVIEEACRGAPEQPSVTSLLRSLVVPRHAISPSPNGVGAIGNYRSHVSGHGHSLQSPLLGLSLVPCAGGGGGSSFTSVDCRLVRGAKTPFTSRLLRVPWVFGLPM